MNPAATGPSQAEKAPLTLVRVVVGVSLLLAGVFKIARPGDFYSALQTYELAPPDGVLRLIAVTLPWLEVILAVALAFDLWPETVRFLVAALCLLFVLTVGQAVGRGLDLHCGCFGPAAGGWFDHPWVALGRSVLLLGAALWLWSEPASPPINPRSPP